MNLSPKEIALKLKQDVDEIIQSEHIHTLLSKSAELYYSGSYLLDCMVYPDVDIHLRVSQGDAFEVLAECAHYYMAQAPRCSRIKMEKAYHLQHAYLPKGVFLGLKFNEELYKSPWKFDIWVMEEGLDEHLEKMANYQRYMTETKREAILTLKHQFITPAGRSSKMGSHHIYDAVLYHGVQDYLELSEYLKSKDIQIPPNCGPNSVFK